MIIKPDFKNSRKAEKAAALIALGADKGSEHRRCLNSEEMAVLVDANCSKGELAIYMQHLGNCEQCYREWLALKTMDKTAVGGAARSRTRPLGRIKKYSFIGSALAVAASVAIFLNLNHIPHMVQETEERAVPGAVLEKSPESPAVQQSNRQADALRNAKTMAPVEQESAPKMKEAPALLPQPAADAVKKTEQAEIYGAGSAQLDIDSWLEELQKSCLSGRQDAEFWREMSVQGQTILLKQAGSLPKNKAEKVSAALTLLHGMETKPVTDQCRQLLALLAEPEKSK